MAKLKISSDDQISYPRITINGDPIDVSIDNREDGNLIIYEVNGVLQGASAFVQSTNFNSQSYDALYDNVIVDNQLNVLSRLSVVESDRTPKLGWNSFYNTDWDDVLGVILSKIALNFAFENIFGYHCFNTVNGEFQQPIVIAEEVTAETATYQPYYSERLQGTDGNSNEADIPNADGTITVNISDGGTPTIYRLLDVNDLVLAEQASKTFTNLDGGTYVIQVEGPNTVGSGVVESIKVTSVLKPLLVTVDSSPDEVNETALVNIIFVQNATGVVQYKLNDGEFQTQSFFEDVPYGQHTLTIEDENNLQAIKILNI